jgi:hypothetical protein
MPSIGNQSWVKQTTLNAWIFFDVVFWLAASLGPPKLWGDFIHVAPRRGFFLSGKASDAEYGAGLVQFVVTGLEEQILFTQPGHKIGDSFRGGSVLAFFRQWTAQPLVYRSNTSAELAQSVDVTIDGIQSGFSLDRRADAT